VPYGRKPKSNGELLLDYGFVIEGNPNTNFLIESPAVELLPKNDQFYDEKIEVLRDVKATHHIAVDSGEDMPDELLGVMRIISISSKEDIERVTMALRKKKISDKNEEKAVSSVVTFLKSLLKRYTTTIKEDEDLLNNKDSLAPNLVSAVVIRKHEKTTLRRLLRNFIDIRDQLSDKGKKKGEKDEL